MADAFPFPSVCGWPDCACERAVCSDAPPEALAAEARRLEAQELADEAIRRRKETALTEAQSTLLVEVGYVGGTVKGNPYTTHILKRGQWKAVCGRQPGNAARPGYRMGDRCGWYGYSTFSAPGRPTCEKCIKAAPGILDALRNSTE